MSVAIGSVSLHRPDLTPPLRQDQRTTLICVAVGDPYWTPADAARAAGRLPHGASIILPESGHIAPLFEAAPAMVDLLTTFWANPGAVVTRQRADATASAPQRPAT
jgi:hypothetical protein